MHIPLCTPSIRADAAEGVCTLPGCRFSGNRHSRQPAHPIETPRLPPHWLRLHTVATLPGLALYYRRWFQVPAAGRCQTSDGPHAIYCLPTTSLTHGVQHTHSHSVLVLPFLYRFARLPPTFARPQFAWTGYHPPPTTHHPFITHERCCHSGLLPTHCYHTHTFPPPSFPQYGWTRYPSSTYTHTFPNALYIPWVGPRSVLNLPCGLDDATHRFAPTPRRGIARGHFCGAPITARVAAPAFPHRIPPGVVPVTRHHTACTTTGCLICGTQPLRPTPALPFGFCLQHTRCSAPGCRCYNVVRHACAALFIRYVGRRSFCRLL